MPPLEHPPILWLDDLYRGSLTEIGRLTLWGMLFSSLSLLASGSYLIAAVFWFSSFTLFTSYVLGFFFRPSANINLRRVGLLKVVEGSTLHYRVEVENAGRRTLRFITVEERGLVPELRPVGPPAVVPELAPGQSCSVMLNVRGIRRGVYLLTHLQVATALPTGMIKRGQRKQVQSEVMVEPLPPESHLPTFPTDREGQSVARAGTSTELIGLREWRSGDQLRDVHWRATARRGELVAKEYADSNFIQRVVWLDVEAKSAREEKIMDEMIAVAIQLAKESARAHVDLTLCHGRQKTTVCSHAKNQRQYGNLIESLVGVESIRKTNFQKLTSQLAGQKHANHLVLMFLRLDSRRRALVSSLRSKGYVLIIWVGKPKQIPSQWRRDPKIEVWS